LKKAVIGDNSVEEISDNNNSQTVLPLVCDFCLPLCCSHRRRKLAAWQAVHIDNTIVENDYGDLPSGRSNTGQEYHEIIPTSRSTTAQIGLYHEIVPTSDPVYHVTQTPGENVPNGNLGGNFIPSNQTMPNNSSAPAVADANDDFDDGELTVVDNPFYGSRGVVSANYELAGELAGPVYDNPSFRNDVQLVRKQTAADNESTGGEALHPGNDYDGEDDYQGYGLTVVDNYVYGNHEERAASTSAPGESTSLRQSTLSDDDLGQTVIDNAAVR